MNPRIAILASSLLSFLTFWSSSRQTQLLQQQALQRQQEQQRQEQIRREQAGFWLQQQERLRGEQRNYLQDIVKQSFQSRNEQQIDLKQLETSILQPTTLVSDPTAMPPLVIPDVSLLAPSKPIALPDLPDHSSHIPTTAADSIVLNESATFTLKTAPGKNVQ